MVLIQTDIKDILRQDNYDFIYIAVGCKINTVGTNAEYQCFPGFLRHMCNNRKKVLAILIDDFEKDYDNANKKFLNYIMKAYPNVTVRTINNSNNVTHENITESASIICSIIQCSLDLLSAFPKDKWMISNYINFKNQSPCTIEGLFHTKLQMHLKQLFEENKYMEYQKNMYYWCGYNKYFINMIASYNEKQLFEISILKLRLLLNKHGINGPIQNRELRDIIDAENLIKMTIRQPQLIDITDDTLFLW